MIFQKNAADTLDFQVNWSAFLGTDTIVSAAWTVPTGIDKESESNTTTTTTIWLSGGTNGASYSLTVTITTASGRIGTEIIEVWITPAHILTIQEAMNVLRMTEANQHLYELLPQVDSYIQNATGHDWSADVVICPEAKAAARMLLVKWFEDPAMNATGQATLSFGLTAVLTQLEFLALQFKEFVGSNGAGSCSVPGARVGDTVDTLVGLIGVSGDQSSKFEAVITVDDAIQQTSTSDLSANYYRVHLISLKGLS